MSRKIRITFEARDKRDGKETLRWLLKQPIDNDTQVDAEITVQPPQPIAVPDEPLESKMSAVAGAELDALAQAAIENQQSGDRAVAIRRRRKDQLAARQQLIDALKTAGKASWKVISFFMKPLIKG